MSGLPEVHHRDPAAHARAVRAMFARISGPYDRLNRLLSLGLDGRWRAAAAACLDTGAREVLDLCAGTGDLAAACRRAGRGRLWLAADFTPQMLRRGRAKPGGADLLWITADSLCLPLRDASVDAVVVGFGMRNLADVRAGVREAARVLRPAGQLVVLEFFGAQPRATGPWRGPPALVRAAIATLVPLAGRLLSGDRAAYSYLAGTAARFLTPRAFADLLRDEGLTGVEVRRQTLGVAHVVAARQGHSRQKM